MINISIFLGIILFLSCLTFTFLRIKKSNRLVLLDWSILAAGLIYGAGWSIVIFLTSQGYNSLWAPRLLPHEKYYLIFSILSFILPACIVIGWHITAKPCRYFFKISSLHLSFDPERTHKYAWATLITSFLLRLVYVWEMGGFIGYIEHAAEIRSALSDVQNKFSFLQPFGMMSIFSSFLFFGSFASGKRSAIKTLGLLLSISFSIYILYSMLGRMGFIMYIATFALAILALKKVRPERIVFSAILSGPITIFAAYLISNTLKINGASNFGEYAARELSFPFGSFFAQLDSGEHLFRWYKDFIYTPLYLLPSSWWTGWVEDASQINTILIEGAKKGDFGVTGGIPVDLMTLGLMQSSVFGVAAVGLLYGGLIRALQSFTDGIQDFGLKAVLWSFISIRVASYAIAYAQPSHLVVGTFGIIFSVIFILSLSILGRIRA